MWEMSLRPERFSYDVEMYGMLTIGCGVYYASVIMGGIHFGGFCLVHDSLLFPSSGTYYKERY